MGSLVFVALVALWGLLASALGCHGDHHPSASDGSAPATGIDPSTPVAWTTACALGGRIGIPSTRKLGTFYYDGHGLPDGDRYCGGAVAVPPNGALEFSAYGDRGGANVFRIDAQIPASGFDVASRRSLRVMDELTAKLTGRPLPIEARQALLAGRTRETKVRGWTLKVHSIRGKGAFFGYRISR